MTANLPPLADPSHFKVFAIDDEACARKRAKVSQARLLQTADSCGVFFQHLWFIAVENDKGTRNARKSNKLSRSSGLSSPNFVGFQGCQVWASYLSMHASQG
eukprot:6475902-Amphidinium_carterae.1